MLDNERQQPDEIEESGRASAEVLRSRWRSIPTAEEGVENGAEEGSEESGEARNNKNPPAGSAVSAVVDAGPEEGETARA